MKEDIGNNSLVTFIQQQFRDSGIDPKHVERSGMRVVQAGDMVGDIRIQHSGLLIQYLNDRGEPTGRLRVRRADSPIGKTASGEYYDDRYWDPPGQKKCLYWPHVHGYSTMLHLAKPSCSAIFQEGEKKALKVQMEVEKFQIDAVVFGIPGIDAGKEVLDDIENIAKDFGFNRRDVYISLDWNMTGKSALRARKTEAKLADLFSHYGANVYLLRWEDSTGKPQEIDEYLAHSDPYAFDRIWEYSKTQQIKCGSETVKLDFIYMMNEKYAVYNGDIVLREDNNTLLGAGKFKELVANVPVPVEFNAGKRGRPMLAGTVWLGHQDRLTVGGFVMRPARYGSSPDGLISEHGKLWINDAVPFPPEWRLIDGIPPWYDQMDGETEDALMERYWSEQKANPPRMVMEFERLVRRFSEDDEQHFHFTSWIVHAYLRPWEITTQAYVLCDGGETGKSLLCSVLRAVFGRRLALTGSTELSTKFNEGLKGKILAIFEEPVDERNANEQIYSNVRRTQGAEYLSVQNKGTNAFEIENVVRILITTNRDRITKIDDTERRFNFRGCDEKLPHAVGVQLAEWIKSPALCHDFYVWLLLHEEQLSRWDPQLRGPVSSRAETAKESSMDDVDHFLKWLREDRCIRLITVEDLAKAWKFARDDLEIVSRNNHLSAAAVTLRLKKKLGGRSSEVIKVQGSPTRVWVIDEDWQKWYQMDDRIAWSDEIGDGLKLYEVAPAKY